MTRMQSIMGFIARGAGRMSILSLTWFHYILGGVLREEVLSLSVRTRNGLRDYSRCAPFLALDGV